VPRYRYRLAHLFCWFVLTLGAPASLWAQEDAVVPPDNENLEDLDPAKFDKRSPLSTARGFMRAAELGDYEAAAEFLDLRYLPKELSADDGPRLAEQLYVVLSREIQIDFGALSRDPLGQPDDGLPSFRDSLGEIDLPSGERQIYLQHVPGTADEMIWKISNATVALVPELYDIYGYSPLVESVRSIVPDSSFLGVEIFKWIISIGSGLVAALASFMIARPLGKVLTHRSKANTERVVSYLQKPIPTAFFIIVSGTVVRELGLGVTASTFADSGTPLTIIITWLLFATVNLLRDLYGNYLESRGRESAFMLLRPIASTAKGLIGVVALTIWLDKVGIDVTALVAGLGVGGIAVALVLQKPLEDILGALTLYTQQPVSLGQFCTCGDITGTIDEINLRSTRIRKINNSVVIIPNSNFATASIENISLRQRILHSQTVRLKLTSTAAQVSEVLAQLSDVLKTDADVVQDEWRVRFFELGEFSMNIEVFAHISTTDWGSFLEISERINLASVEVLANVGVEFGYPRN